MFVSLCCVFFLSTQTRESDVFTWLGVSGVPGQNGSSQPELVASSGSISSSTQQTGSSLPDHCTHTDARLVTNQYSVLFEHCKGIQAPKCAPVTASCGFSGKEHVWPDQCRRAEAWTARVWAGSVWVDSDGSWCDHVQPPGLGFLSVHSSKPQSQSNSTGHQDVRVSPTSFQWMELLQRTQSDSGWFVAFRSPSNWTADTVELLGPLILLDDSVVSALPNEVCIFLTFNCQSSSFATCPTWCSKLTWIYLLNIFLLLCLC